MNQNTNSGAAAIISILAVSAVALAASISISFLSISNTKTSVAFKNAMEAAQGADGCAEEALLRLRNDDTYTGGDLQLGEVDCTITISGLGSSRIIDIEAVNANRNFYVSRLQVEVERGHMSINIINYKYTN